MFQRTPQESEQLSKYVSDDTYVKKQKEDIEELTEMFKQMMGGPLQDEEKNSKEFSDEFIRKLNECFCPVEGFQASYGIQFIDKDKTLIVEIAGDQLKCYYGNKEDVEVYAKSSYEVFSKVVHGKMTFQKAFMSGEITAKGNFKTLRMFDSIFQFGDK